jgi:hypothetical protein
MKIGNKWVLAALLTLASSSLSAAPITGSFNIIGTVTVSGAVVDWQSNGGTTGSFATEVPATGDFAGLSCGNPPFCTGVAKDLLPPPGPVLSFLSGFTAPGFGTLFFDMTAIIPPGAPACSTVTNPGLNVDCTLGAFTLKNTASGVAVDFGLTGFFQRGADLTSRNSGIGLYTTQLVGATVLGVVQTINTGGSISASYSGNYIASATIPEPGTAAMLGIGAIAMFLGRMRSKRRSNS